MNTRGSNLRTRLRRDGGASFASCTRDRCEKGDSEKRDKRRRDIRNAESMMKAAYDGIVDAGILADDSYDVLTHQPTVFERDPECPRVEIVVERVG